MLGRALLCPASLGLSVMAGRRPMDRLPWSRHRREDRIIATALMDGAGLGLKAAQALTVLYQARGQPLHFREVGRRVSTHAPLSRPGLQAAQDAWLPMFGALAEEGREYALPAEGQAAVRRVLTEMGAVLLDLGREPIATSGVGRADNDREAEAKAGAA